jgi:hypothetical protein
MSESSGQEMVRFLPLAITRVDDSFGCVGAVRETGGWVRPEPVRLADVESPASPYRYFHWTSAVLGPSTEPDARPEDRDIQEAGPPRLESALFADLRRSFVRGRLDADVERAFSDGRSLGLIEARLIRFYIKRSTGGRSFVRAVFRDPSETEYDWIVPDLSFNRAVWPHVSAGELEPEWSERLHLAFAGLDLYLALGLTKPNDRFPGKFGGCHPLVVGVHTIPDYLPALGTGPEDGGGEGR